MPGTTSLRKEKEHAYSERTAVGLPFPRPVTSLLTEEDRYTDLESWDPLEQPSGWWHPHLTAIWNEMT